MSSVLYSVRANKPIAYDLIVSKNLFSHRNAALLTGRAQQGGSIVVVADEFIYDSLKDEIESYFSHHKIKLTLVRCSSAEVNKNLDSYTEILKAIDTAGIKRRSEPVLAIGGGVVMDIVGFACSTYRRSVPCIKVPTTLMGYVDAAIGIKHGVDFGGNKNRVGSFDPPFAVILDTGFLQTLPRRHLINGMGEIFKIAVIKDKSLYTLLNDHGREAILNSFQGNGPAEEILNKSIVGLITELEGNLYETELKRPSDFGHTFSPIIEMANINDMLHGEAVSIDIAISCVIAARRELMSMQALSEIMFVMKKLELPTFHPSITEDMLRDGLIERTLHRNGQQNTPMPVITLNKHTTTFLQDISWVDIEYAVDYLRTIHG